MEMTNATHNRPQQVIVVPMHRYSLKDVPPEEEPLEVEVEAVEVEVLVEEEVVEVVAITQTEEDRQEMDHLVDHRAPTDRETYDRSPLFCPISITMQAGGFLCKLRKMFISAVT